MTTELKLQVDTQTTNWNITLLCVKFTLAGHQLFIAVYQIKFSKNIFSLR